MFYAERFGIMVKESIAIAIVFKGNGEIIYEREL